MSLRRIWEGGTGRLTALIVLVTLLTVVGCSSGTEESESVAQSNETILAATPVPVTATPSLTILAFGDSLTAGFGVDDEDNFPSQLQAKLQADGYDATVINGGISGETSSAALSRVDWMLQTEPDIVIVETGANDALRGVDLALTSDNIDTIVGQFSESGAVVVVAGLQIIQNLGEEYTTEFAAMYPAAAEKHDAILIPFVLEGVAADPAYNLPDFIHPNGDGYAVMVDHIYPFIIEAIEVAEERR